MQYEGDLIVGGAGNRLVTPNFRLSEYADAHGRIRIHRDTVAAVQVVRDLLAAPVRVAGVDPSVGPDSDARGLFCWLAADNLGLLEKAARSAMKDRWLGTVERRDQGVYVAIPNPDDPPRIRPQLALEHAILVTAGFETQGDPYQAVTGNFDGAGMSFGPLQVNFGTGTLPKLFDRFRQRDEAGLRRCFGSHYGDWQAVLRMTRPDQIQWADRQSFGANKGGVREPWKGYLKAVGRQTAFRKETRGYAFDEYGRKLIAVLSWLDGVSPIRIDNFRCLAALFDLCVQQGGLSKAHERIRREVTRHPPSEQFALVRIAVVERGRTAKPRWRADCISRRLTILDRRTRRIIEAGETASRNNPLLYLVRNTGVNNVEQYLL